MKDAAVLCGLRVNKRRLQVLLAKRSPTYSFPLECVFPGGRVEPSDHSWVHTAVREFREELNYFGSLSNIRPIADVVSGEYSIHFYAARVHDDPTVGFKPNPEIIDLSWYTPQGALDFFNSPLYIQTQLEGLVKSGIDKRQVPIATLDVLYQLHFARSVYSKIARE